MSEGVWVKVHPDDAPGGAPGAAVINDAASNYNNKDSGVVIDGKTYDIYTFTDDTATDLSLTVSEPGLVDALLVGGGGAGNLTSNNHCGGGGAGDFVELSVYLEARQHHISVGSGGISVPYTTALQDSTGTQSMIVPVSVATGGSGSAHSHPTPNIMSGGSLPGASSGGATGGVGFPTGNALGLNGHQGAVTGTNAQGGGGGGGAGGPGGEASGTTGGDGGAGKSSMITGSERWFAAGGGGAGSSTSGQSASGVGGVGWSSNGPAVPPATNSGSGGGGNNLVDGKGNGAAGIVIVRVEV